LLYKLVIVYADRIKQMFDKQTMQQPTNSKTAVKVTCIYPFLNFISQGIKNVASYSLFRHWDTCRLPLCRRAGAPSLQVPPSGSCSWAAAGRASSARPPDLDPCSSPADEHTQRLINVSKEHLQLRHLTNAGKESYI